MFHTVEDKRFAILGQSLHDRRSSTDRVRRHNVDDLFVYVYVRRFTLRESSRIRPAESAAKRQAISKVLAK